MQNYNINSNSIPDNSVNINNVPDGATMLVRGIVDFSQVTKKLEGTELDADNARKIQHGLKTESRSHTRLAISQASVVFENASSPTIAEKYIESRLYQSQKYPSKNYMYSALNKGQFLPAVYVRDKIDFNTISQISPKGELAAGLEVTLLLKVYSTALGNKGVSLEAIICDEPIRYTGAGTSDAMSSLFARGFKIMTPAANPPPAYSAAISA
jgi:hypothetical protein